MTISSLFVELHLKADNFNNSLKDAQREAKEFEKTVRPTTQLLNDMGSAMTSAGQAATVGLTLPIVAMGAFAVQNFNESAKAAALMENAIRSTGGAAGKTATELQAMATALEANSIFGDDEIITKVTNQLLTFTNIAGDSFDRATQAALDMSTMLGQDLQSSAMQLGKALNDPVAGVTALQRVGVKLTESQKDMVKAFMESGDIMGAQNVILQELQVEFGGAAAAAAAVGSGPMTVLWNRIGNLTESWGELISKAILPFIDIATRVVDRLNRMDESTKAVVLVIAALLAIVGPVLVVLGTMATALASLITAWATIGPLITAAGAAFSVLTPVLTAVGAILTGPVGITIAIIAATAALSAFVMKNETLSKLLDPIWTAVGNAINTTVEFIKKIWGGLWDFIVGAPGRAKDAILSGVRGVTDGVTGFFKDMYDKVVGQSYVPDMLERIAREFGRLPNVMLNPAREVTNGVVDLFADMFNTTTAGAQQWIGGLSSIFNSLSGGGGGGGGGFWSGLLKTVGSIASAFIPGVGPLISTAIAGAQLGYNAVSSIANRNNNGGGSPAPPEDWRTRQMNIPGTVYVGPVPSAANNSPVVNVTVNGVIGSPTETARLIGTEINRLIQVEGWSWNGAVSRVT